MELKIQKDFNTDNPLTVLKSYVAALNALTKEIVGVEPFTLEGNVLGYEDGGYLGALDAVSAKKCQSLDLSDLSDTESIAYLVSNVTRYGLISHNAFDRIKIGPGKSQEPLPKSAIRIWA